MEDDDVTFDGVSVSKPVPIMSDSDDSELTNYSQVTSIKNHPYQNMTSDPSVKPYMSQPMSSAGLDFDHGEDETKEERRSLDGIGAGYENSSARAATTRNHVVPEPERAQPCLASSTSNELPTARSHQPHGFKAFSRNTKTTSLSHSISSALLNGTQAGFAIIGFGIGKRTGAIGRTSGASAGDVGNANGSGRSSGVVERGGFTQPMASMSAAMTTTKSPMKDRRTARDKMSDAGPVTTFTFPRRQQHDSSPESGTSKGKIIDDGEHLASSVMSVCMEPTPSPDTIQALQTVEVRSSGIDADVIVKSDRKPDSIIIPRPRAVPTLDSLGALRSTRSASPPGHRGTIPPGQTELSEPTSPMPTCAITEGVHHVTHSAAGYVDMGGDDKVNVSELHTTRIIDKDLVADAPCAVLGGVHVADQAITTTRTMQYTTTSLPSGHSKTRTSGTNLTQTPMTSCPPPPRRTLTTISTSSKLPRLSLGAIDRRLSFNGLLEGSARLSPSIISRPLPLPLLNLPVLMTPGGSRTNVEGADNKSRPSGLMGMPALPLRGSSRGTRGHEEVDDLEEGDEEDDDEGATSGSGPGTGEHTEKGRSSFSSGKSTDDEDLGDVDNDDRGIANKLSLLASSETSPSISRTSSYETARAELSPTTSEACHESLIGQPLDKRSPRTPCLPQVGSSGFGVDVSPLLDWNSPGMSHPMMRSPAAQRQSHGNVDMKGKSKQREEEEGFDNLNEDILPHTRNVCRVPNRQSQDDGYGRGDRLPRTPVQSRQGRTSTSAKLTANTPHITGNLTKTLTSDNRNQTSTRSGYAPPRPPLIRLSASGGGTITQNPGMYKRASKSLIDVRSIEKKEMVEKMVRDQEEEEETRRRSRKISKMSVRVNSSSRGVHEGRGGRNLSRVPSDGQSVRESFKTAEEMLWEEGEDKDGDLLAVSEEGRVDDSKATNTTSLAPIFEAPHPLRRRRSMPTTNPPPYSGLAPHISSFKFQRTVQPREDEGREKLPSYSNEIHLRAIMPRKMELVAPGILAKDRKWRRVLCVLEGTVFKVYKCPVGVGGVSTIGEWWESKVGAGLEPSSPSVNFGNVLGGTRSGGSGDNSFDQTGEVLRREIQLARARKIGETGQPILQRNGLVTPIQPQSQPVQPKALGHHSSHSLGIMPTTKSALTFAVQLLKPGTKHKRSNSDVAPRSPQRQSPRSSFNIPRSSSGRTTPATTSNHGVDSTRSHSPSTASTHHLTTPATSSTVFSRLSRPSTPTPSVGASSAHTRSTVHPGSTSSERASSPRPTGSHHANDAKEKTQRDVLLELDENDLIRTYTMQHAESGLGKDYTKRQHVIRVRLEGEQFLLQAKNVESVIGWIEGLQAATNVALDLDERPMPAGPMIPRRRRRRRRAAAAASASSPVDTSVL